MPLLALAVMSLPALAACSPDDQASGLRSLGEGSYEAVAVEAAQIALDVAAIEQQTHAAKGLESQGLDAAALNTTLGLNGPFQVVSVHTLIAPLPRTEPAAASGSGSQTALTVPSTAVCVEDITLDHTVTLLATPSSVDMLFAPTCTTDPQTADIRASHPHPNPDATRPDWTLTPSAQIATASSWEATSAALNRVLDDLAAAEQARRTLLTTTDALGEILNGTRDRRGLYPGLSAQQVNEQHLAPLLDSALFAPLPSRPGATQDPAASPAPAPQPAQPAATAAPSDTAPGVGNRVNGVEVAVWQPQGATALLCLSDPHTRAWVFVELPSADQSTRTRREAQRPLGEALYFSRSGLSGPLCQPLGVTGPV